MAITSSAKKAIRASARKRVFNVRRKNAVESALKNIKKLIALKKVSEARALMPKAYQAIDKAVKTHYFKANTGARMKSRLSAFLKKHQAI